MNKKDIDKFTTEVVSQVMKGVKDARIELNISILSPEYIDFTIDVDGQEVSFRVLTI